MYILSSCLIQSSRSGLSDTTPTDVASPAESDEEEVFTYPARDDSVADVHRDQEEEEFVYPDNSLDATAHQNPLVVSKDAPQHPLPPQDSAVESITVVEAQSSPLPSPQAQVSSHPSPAQLEALSTAASQGDLVLLKKLFATALHGDLEPFTLANNASSRTGLTPLHAAASRGYLDMVKWRESPFQVFSFLLTLVS